MSIKCELLDNVNRAIEYLENRIDTLVPDKDRDGIVQPTSSEISSIIDQWIEDLRKVLSILTGEE